MTSTDVQPTDHMKPMADVKWFVRAHYKVCKLCKNIRKFNWPACITIDFLNFSYRLKYKHKTSSHDALNLFNLICFV